VPGHPQQGGEADGGCSRRFGKLPGNRQGSRRFAGSTETARLGKLEILA